jgi:rod shape-determining protein MreC
LKDFFNSVKFRVILFILVVLVGISVYTVASGGQSSVISQGVYKVFTPVLRVTSSISDTLTAQWDSLFHSNDYYEENLKLKEELSDLNEKLVDYENNKQELEELRKFINIKEENPNYELSPPCNVIAKTSGDPYCTFTIDRGADDGISLYDPVVTGEGLVGTVTELANDYAVVTTILSSDISVGAMSVRTTDMGVIEGDTEQSLKGLTKLSLLDKDNKLSVGDVITCSGNSGMFPKNFLIGKVVELGTEDTGLSAYAIVEPFVDINKLTSVIVITNFDGQGIGSSS